MVSVSIDLEADVASVDLLPGLPITRSVRVGGSLIANYGDDGSLISVDFSRSARSCDRTLPRSCVNSSAPPLP